MDNNQPAAKPDWKIGLVPKNAGNRTDPLVASNQEVEAVIANPSSMQPPQPVKDVQIEAQPELDAAPRYNANVPYTPPVITYNENDKLVIRAVHIAVQNGWQDYHRFANDATTIGMEGEAVVAGMKKRGAKVEELLLDKDFNRKLWGVRIVPDQSLSDDKLEQPGWEYHLREMAVSDNLMQYLKANLPDGDTQ